MTPLPIDGLDKPALSLLVADLGEKPYRANQLFSWMHAKCVDSWDAMTDLPKAFRERLAAEYPLSRVIPVAEQASRIDGTRKLLLELDDGNRIEAVLLADNDRLTGCISTQVGCRMGCAFCATAKIGLIRNLSAGEIVRQVYALSAVALREHGRPLSNLVFMGMGEALDNPDATVNAINILMHEDGQNFSHRKITVSTAGLTDRLSILFDRLDYPVKLALSLNAAEQKKRELLMPVARKHPLDRLVAELKRLPFNMQHPLTVEYILMHGVNDSLEDADAVAKLLRGIPAKVNLIRYNATQGSPYAPVPEKDALKFQQHLIKKGITTFVRKSMGGDIDGACGQLYANYSRPADACGER